MKKFISFSLSTFLAIITGVLIVNFISSQNTNQSINNFNNNSNTGNANQINKILTLDMTEISKHNSFSSCWLLISGKIYDVTSYLNSHPGGEVEILKTCGTDATVIYDNRDNTGTHSSGARSMLADYYIGNLNQSVKTSQANPTTPPIANPAVKNSPTSNFREFDD